MRYRMYPRERTHFLHFIRADMIERIVCCPNRTLPLSAFRSGGIGSVRSLLLLALLASKTIVLSVSHFIHTIPTTALADRVRNEVGETL